MIRACLIILLCLAPSTASALDPEASKSLAAEAQLALEQQRPAAAATLFDQAHALDPHPVWRLAAAEAWLQSMDAARAVERLEDALASADLAEFARGRATERLALANKLAPIFSRARQATRDQQHVKAATAWQDAFALYPLGRIQLEAARSTQRAKLPQTRTLYSALAERKDLSPEERAEVGDVLARLDPNPQLPPPAPDTTLAWSLVISGAACVAGGAVMLAVASDQRSEVTAAITKADAGLVTDLTRAEARERESDAKTLYLAGLITGAAGLALTGTGIGLFVDQVPTPATTVVPNVAATWRIGATLTF